MNFSSHQNKLIEAVAIALDKNSSELIDDFKQILSTAKKLYRTESFNFWLSEIGRHPKSELPITVYGHRIAVSNLKWLRKSKQNNVPGVLNGICHNLFTYFNDDDMCHMQSDYHYYFSTKGNCVYKESDMGWIEGLDIKPQKGEYRIALKSELKVSSDEYYP